MSDLLNLLPLVGILLLFWFLLIRPAQRRQRETTAMQRALAVGDDVILTSGILGTITDLTDDQAHLEVAPGVTLRVARAAVGGLAPDQRAATPPDDTRAPEQAAGGAVEEN